MLIGVSGKAFSGKDTVADIICFKFGGTKYRFAFPAYQAVKIAFNLTERDFQRDRKEKIMPEWGLSPRQLMQKFATDFARDMIDPDVWVKRAAMEYENLKAADPKVLMIIPDVRFDNEADWIRSAGGTIIIVDRPDSCYQVAEHKSENGITRLPEDIVIVNDGSLSELNQLTVEAVEYIYGEGGVSKRDKSSVISGHVGEDRTAPV